MFLKKITIKKDLWFKLSRENSNNFELKTVTYKIPDRSKPIQRRAGFGGFGRFDYEMVDIKEQHFKLFSKGFSIEFNSNINIITGENGIGKSTLMNFIKPPETDRLSNLRMNDDGTIIPEEEVIKEKYKKYLNNASVKLNFSKNPNYIILGNKIHKNDLIKSYSDNFSESNALKPQNLLTIWDMQSFSNGENILDYVEGLKQIQNSLIVLDEPETSLSINSQLKIKETLLEVSKTNQLIIITHSPIIMSLSEQIYDFNLKLYKDTKTILESYKALF
jgi:predicted ATPase